MKTQLLFVIVALCVSEKSSIVGAATAEGRSNAGESVSYREFPWPVLAGYTGNGNDGISQHELSVKGKWCPCICTPKGQSKSVEAAVVPAKSSHHYSGANLRTC